MTIVKIKLHFKAYEIFAFRDAALGLFYDEQFDDCIWLPMRMLEQVQHSDHFAGLHFLADTEVILDSCVDFIHDMGRSIQFSTEVEIDQDIEQEGEG